VGLNIISLFIGFDNCVILLQISFMLQLLWLRYLFAPISTKLLSRHSAANAMQSTKNIAKRKQNVSKLKEKKVLNDNVISSSGLPCLKVRDALNDKILEVNSEFPIEIETDMFKGQILILLNTEGALEKYNRYRDHFSGKFKPRKFEIQVQGKFKSIPKV
jgi:hypothetical protein